MFDDKINGIIQNLYKEGTNEWVSHETMKKGTSPDQTQKVEGWRNRMKWFSQLERTLQAEFDPYLRVKK
jgi:hypothetical protein